MDEYEECRGYLEALVAAVSPTVDSEGRKCCPICLKEFRSSDMSLRDLNHFGDCEWGRADDYLRTDNK